MGQERRQNERRSEDAECVGKGGEGCGGRKDVTRQVIRKDSVMEGLAKMEKC